MNPQLNLNHNPEPNPAPNPFAGLEVKASGADPLPPGVYFALYRGVEAFSNDKVTGKLKWAWEVVSGSQKGWMATALTDSHITPQTHAGRLIAGLVLRPLVPGENVGTLWDEMQKAVGQMCRYRYGRPQRGQTECAIGEPSAGIAIPNDNTNGAVIPLVLASLTFNLKLIPL